MNAPAAAQSILDPTQIRSEFPVLERTVHGHPLVYLDNAATTQKPSRVLNRIRSYYEQSNANVHRGVHTLSQEATDQYEAVRSIVADFLGTPDPSSIVFTKGTTDAINLVANGFAKDILKPGDEILLTGMEHHSNIVPWQLAAEASGATIRVAPVDETGTLYYPGFQRLLSEKTRVVAVVHVSNTLGTINPVERIIADAHSFGAAVLIDGAQATPHLQLDVAEMDADFYCFSAHKVYGPTGAGALYGKPEWLDRLPPYQGGGDMISSVTFEKTTYNDVPHKFEAGTPNIAGVIGMGEALDFVESLGRPSIEALETQLLLYGTTRLQEIDGLRLIGTADHKSAVISFLLGDAHPYDVATVLDQLGVAVRTGHHCTQPLMTQYGIPGTIRASFAVYNTTADIDRLVEGVEKANKLLA